VEMGACIYIDDKDLEPNKLRDSIYSLLDNPIKMEYLKQNSSYLAKFDATEKIVECIKTL
jgi:UDP-N-acetylglucosamine:LPS N-acetylglucosamine transferase